MLLSLLLPLDSGYYFAPKAAIEQGIYSGAFVAYDNIEVGDKNISYGLSKGAIADVRLAGRICILDIDLSVRATILDVVSQYHALLVVVQFSEICKVSGHILPLLSEILLRASSSTVIEFGTYLLSYKQSSVES